MAAKSVKQLDRHVQSKYYSKPTFCTAHDFMHTVLLFLFASVPVFEQISTNCKLQHSLFGDVLDHDRSLGVADLEPYGVHRLQAVSHVVEDEVTVLQQLVMLVT